MRAEESGENNLEAAWQMSNGLPVIFHFVLLQLVNHSSASAYGLKGVFGWGWGMHQFPGISDKSEPRDLPSVNFDKPDREVPKYLWPLPQNSCESGETPCPRIWGIMY